MTERLEGPLARTWHSMCSGFRSAAVRALLIQLISLFVIFALSVAQEVYFAASIPLLLLGVMQGGLAALLSRWAGLPVWWWVIQFCFPIGFIAVSILELPPAIFLAAFVSLLLLYWTTFRTQVPFFPSTRSTRDSVAGLLPLGQSVSMIDIGSGLGDMVMDLAGRRPDCRFTGIEVAPLPWLASVMRARMRRSNANFIRGDYTALDLGQFDIVFAFLSPAAMPSLWEQAQRQMRSGTLLLSYEFAIPAAPADVVIAPDERGASLYGWHIRRLSH